MRSQLLISFGVISMLSLSSCATTEAVLVQPIISATPTMIPVEAQEETVDMDVLDKPLPELDEIEALLAEYSGTDVN